MEPHSVALPPYGWHDNLIYSISFDIGSSAAGDFRAALVLDIDHIAEWVCGGEGPVKFKVAPATMTFHDVTDLRIALDFGRGNQARNSQRAIHRLDRP